MADQADLEQLDMFERCAHDRLEPVLGPLKLIDRPGGPPGMHDFQAKLPSGSVVAIEVTGQVESERLRQAAAAQRCFFSVKVAGSALQWEVGLAADARVRAISPDDLRCLLRDLGRV